MLDVIGAILANATAIAVSPVPIIAVILMLMSPTSTRRAIVFLLGWVVGVVVAVTVFSFVGGVLPEPDGSSAQPVLGVVLLLLGAGLLFLGAKQWRSRPRPGQTPQLPAWMSKLTDMRVGAAFALAFALAALNPKNLLLTAAAGAEIGRAGLGIVDGVVVGAVFTLVASLTVLAPVVFALVAPKTAASALEAIRTWLTANNAVIMVVLFVILGAKVIGNGLSAF